MMKKTSLILVCSLMLLFQFACNSNKQVEQSSEVKEPWPDSNWVEINANLITARLEQVNGENAYYLDVFYRLYTAEQIAFIDSMMLAIDTASFKVESERDITRADIIQLAGPGEMIETRIQVGKAEAEKYQLSRQVPVLYLEQNPNIAKLKK